MVAGLVGDPGGERLAAVGTEFSAQDREVDVAIGDVRGGERNCLRRYEGGVAEKQLDGVSADGAGRAEAHTDRGRGYGLGGIQPAIGECARGRRGRRIGRGDVFGEGDGGAGGTWVAGHIGHPGRDRLHPVRAEIHCRDREVDVAGGNVGRSERPRLGSREGRAADQQFDRVICRRTGRTEVDAEGRAGCALRDVEEVVGELGRALLRRRARCWQGERVERERESRRRASRPIEVGHGRRDRLRAVAAEIGEQDGEVHIVSSDVGGGEHASLRRGEWRCVQQQIDPVSRDRTRGAETDPDRRGSGGLGSVEPAIAELRRGLFNRRRGRRRGRRVFDEGKW